jgi:hypothetical protein
MLQPLAAGKGALYLRFDLCHLLAQAAQHATQRSPCRLKDNINP